MIDYACCTRIGRRQENEDNCHIPQPGGLPFVIVADGMGGHKAGRTASAMAIAEILASLGESLPDENAIRAAVDRANYAIYEHSRQDFECRGMGTTVVFAAMEEASYIAGNIGDSRIYHYGKNGLRQVSRDHSLVAILLAIGEITEEQARVHPQRNVITRALGTRDQERLDIFHETWEEGDILLLCSDGLHGSISEEEMIEVLRKGGSLQQRCDALVELAFENGSMDNITVVLAENLGVCP